MAELPPTSPHFYGLIAAVIGLVALLIWMRSGRTKGSLGRRRWLIAAPVLAGLVILGLFGNGVYGHASRATLPRLRMMWLPHTDDEIATATKRALEVALSDEFIRYFERLHDRPVTFTGEELRQRLQVRRVRYADLSTYGIHIRESPPVEDVTWHLYEYYDSTNFGLYLLHLAGLGEREQEMSARLQYLDRMRHAIDELIALELLRNAQSDKHRLAALRALATGSPTLAEWIRRDLRRFSQQTLSGEVARKVDELLAHVQRYIDEPSRRGLAAAVDLAQ